MKNLLKAPGDLLNLISVLGTLIEVKKNRTSKHKNAHSRPENNLSRRKLYFKYFKGPKVFKDNKLSWDKK